jgi:putative endonuclease
MAKHLDAGIWGEQQAVRYLLEYGYEIVCVNWRYRHLEVDVIAKDNGVLVFVEVKSRTDSRFGDPKEFVDHKKKRNLIRLADAYISYTKYEGEIRFDIVSVFLTQNKIELIKDAFWSN